MKKDSRRSKAGFHWVYPPFWKSEANPSPSSAWAF